MWGKYLPYISTPSHEWFLHMNSQALYSKKMSWKRTKGLVLILSDFQVLPKFITGCPFLVGWAGHSILSLEHRLLCSKCPLAFFLEDSMWKPVNLSCKARPPSCSNEHCYIRTKDSYAPIPLHAFPWCQRCATKITCRTNTCHCIFENCSFVSVNLRGF